MKTRQQWIFDNFQMRLSGLKPKVRSKAIEIAEHLIDEGGQPENQAIENAIKRAQEWFLDTKG